MLTKEAISPNIGIIAKSIKEGIKNILSFMNKRNAVKISGIIIVNLLEVPKRKINIGDKINVVSVVFISKFNPLSIK